MEDLEPFYPDRMASRILGMGDVLSLIDIFGNFHRAELIAHLEHRNIVVFPYHL